MGNSPAAWPLGVFGCLSGHLPCRAGLIALHAELGMEVDHVMRPLVRKRPLPLEGAQHPWSRWLHVLEARIAEKEARRPAAAVEFVAVDAVADAGSDLDGHTSDGGKGRVLA